MWPLGALRFFPAKQDGNASSTQSMELWENPLKDLCPFCQLLHVTCHDQICPMVGMKDQVGLFPPSEVGLLERSAVCSQGREKTPLPTGRDSRPGCATATPTRRVAD